MIEKKEKTKNFIDKIIVRLLQDTDRRNFSQKEKILLFKELSYLIKGGISLNEATQILQDSTDNFALKDMAYTIQNYLKKGSPLSYALARLPDYFNEGDVAIIKTGEASGKLSIVLESLAYEYEYTADIKNKYIGAMIYPIILFFIAIIAVISLFSLVLPSIFSIADNFQNIQLPRTTQLLRNISTFLGNHRKELLGGIGGVGIITGLFFSTEKGRKTWFSFILQIPLIGKMTQYYYIVKFCRYLKLMNNSGMSYIETLYLLKEIINIPNYQEMIEKTINNLKEGKDIYSSLRYETTLLPTDVSIMIKVGEHTANLSQSLQNILTMYEGELNKSINRLSKVIEPIMLIGMGGVVVIIAYAVFGLILQIMEGSGL